MNNQEELSVCEQCEKLFHHHKTTATSRFDFCSVECELLYQKEHPKIEKKPDPDWIPLWGVRQ